MTNCAIVNYHQSQGGIGKYVHDLERMLHDVIEGRNIRLSQVGMDIISLGTVRYREAVKESRRWNIKILVLVFDWYNINKRSGLS